MPAEKARAARDGRRAGRERREPGETLSSGLRTAGVIFPDARPRGILVLVGAQARLVVLSGPDAGAEFALRPGATSIGRGAENEIVLRDPFVSRRHLLIRQTGDELWLEDLGARNAVFLNGTPAREARLRSGDRLLVGKTELIVLSIGPGEEVGDPSASTLVAPRLLDAKAADPFAKLIGNSPALLAAKDLLRRAAALCVPVLIFGETGTGKELAALALHRASARGAGPFVAVNAAAIPVALAEAELFGHEKGAFTGAFARRRGQFEIANGGTFFLDEVGELDLSLQAKLLRVLETGAFRRVGGSEEVRADFRIVAATNRDLSAEVAAGRFRADLFFRLNVLSIRMPALRDRPEDIPLLAQRFAAEAARECGRPLPELTEASFAALKKRPWPGNVRELKNALFRAILRASGGRLEPRDFLDAGELAAAAPAGAAQIPRALREVEREEIERVLRFASGNKTRAAEILGISRNTLYEKLRAYGIG